MNGISRKYFYWGNGGKQIIFGWLLSLFTKSSGFGSLMWKIILRACYTHYNIETECSQGAAQSLNIWMVKLPCSHYILLNMHNVEDSLECYYYIILNVKFLEYKIKHAYLLHTSMGTSILYKQYRYQVFLILALTRSYILYRFKKYFLPTFIMQISTIYPSSFRNISEKSLIIITIYESILQLVVYGSGLHL